MKARRGFHEAFMSGIKRVSGLANQAATSSWSAIARKKQLPSDATSLTRNPSAASSAARPSPFHDAAYLPRQLCGSHLRMLQEDDAEDSDALWSL